MGARETTGVRVGVPLPLVGALPAAAGVWLRQCNGLFGWSVIFHLIAVDYMYVPTFLSHMTRS